MGVAFGLGFVIGPAIGGLLGAIDPRLPFWVAAAFSLANAAYGWFVLPESLPPERRMAFAWRRANPVGVAAPARRASRAARARGGGFPRPARARVLPAVFVLYAGYRYGWGERDGRA